MRSATSRITALRHSRGFAPPLLNRPSLLQGFSQGLGVPVHDPPSLKRLLLPLDLCPQLPIALDREPLHPVRRIEGGSLKRQFVIFQLGITSVDSGNLGRLKSVLLQQCLGALLVVQERDNSSSTFASRLGTRITMPPQAPG